MKKTKSGRYWFGTNAGISVYDPAVDAKQKVQFFSDEKNLIGDKIRFLKSDQKGNIWIGTEGRGLLRYDLKSEKFVYDIRISENLHSNNYITALEIDKKNRIWIGNMDRLVVWDPENRAGKDLYTE